MHHQGLNLQIFNTHLKIEPDWIEQVDLPKTHTQISLHVQSNPAILNSVDLIQSQVEFPGIFPYFSSHLLSAISNSVILNSPCFPRTKINPVISNFSTLMDKQQNMLDRR